VGSEFARTRGTVFFILCLLVLAAAIGTTLGTHRYLPQYKSLIALYVGLYLVGAIFLFRSLYYLTMKVSTIEAPNA